VTRAKYFCRAKLVQFAYSVDVCIMSICHCVGWWRGVVGNAFQLKRSYSTPGTVSTAMGDCLRQVNHLGAKPAS